VELSHDKQVLVATEAADTEVYAIEANPPKLQLTGGLISMPHFKGQWFEFESSTSIRQACFHLQDPKIEQ